MHSRCANLELAEAYAVDAVLDLEQPCFRRRCAGIGALDAVLIRRRPPHRFKLGMAGQHLIVDTADPVPPRADLAVGQGRKRRAERRAELAKHLFDRVGGMLPTNRTSRAPENPPICRFYGKELMFNRPRE